jgi:protein SCO1/2
VTATVERGSNPASPAARPARVSLGLQVAALVVAAVVTLAGLLGITALVGPPGGAARPTPTAPTFLVDQVRPAAGLELTGTDGRPFSLASMRGRGALVFFGYTHCPDVCPATIGIVGQLIDRVGPAVGAVFVTIDPERDTVAWLAEYVRYLPTGFVALSGTAEAVRTTADAWGARYARVDTETPGKYSMTHTANVYLVDQAGLLRAVFPFGTRLEEMLETVEAVLATPAGTAYPPTQPPTPAETVAPTVEPSVAPPSAGVTAAPTTAPTPAPTEATLRAEVVSSSVWAGGSSPIILALYLDGIRLNDPAADVRVQLTSTAGGRTGAPVVATPVQPPGVDEVSYVATVDVPNPGWWRLAITVSTAGATSVTTTSVAALDPGATAPFGEPAPAVRTPTLADVGGDIRRVSTDPAPDPRLYQTSTADALAAHQPFVLVVDSSRFRTSPECGKALVMARYLLQRWPAVPFIHLEPFEYTIVSDAPVLNGALSNPTLVPAAAAWGLGQDPWPSTAQPWIFVVDGNGLVRAKYRDIIGSADVDVIVSMIQAGG